MFLSTERRGRFTRLTLTCLFSAFYAVAAQPIPPEKIRDLAFGENDARVEAIAALVADGEDGALALLQALSDGEIQTSGEQVLKAKDKAAVDVITGKAVDPIPATLDDIVLNNRVRRELATGIAALKLTSADRATRLAAAKELQRGAAEAMLS